MAFERSRQQNVSLTQALTDLVAELDHVTGSNALARAVPDDGVEVMGGVFRSAKDVADAIVESQRHGQRQDE